MMKYGHTDTVKYGHMNKVEYGHMDKVKYGHMDKMKYGHMDKVKYGHMDSIYNNNTNKINVIFMMLVLPQLHFIQTSIRHDTGPSSSGTKTH